MVHADRGSLQSALSTSEDLSDRYLSGYDTRVALRDLVAAALEQRIEKLRGRSVLIATKDQLKAAIVLIELDGIARRLVLCPPDLSPDHLPLVIKTAAVEAVVSDSGTSVLQADAASARDEDNPNWGRQTQWVLLTSGTTGAPKMVAHTLSSLAGALKKGAVARREERPVWSTFYDIRRYGGLQIFLRAILGGGSLVLSSAVESTGDFLTRLAAHNVTHISGTPSHWRRALMSPAAHKISPHYVRLSGEIADQAILDSLREAYPKARIAHAFASTEAGVGFAVEDGRAGFPASMVAEPGAEVALKILDGSLRIRSARTATRYLGGNVEVLTESDGFVDTGDMVELRGERYYFVGRRGGIINVGGLKVHPEEVEAVINRHPNVQMSLVKTRKSPITGAIVVADVVLTSEPGSGGACDGTELLKSEILNVCRDALPPHKVPAAIRFVPSLPVSGAGKLARS